MAKFREDNTSGFTAEELIMLNRVFDRLHDNLQTADPNDEDAENSYRHWAYANGLSPRQAERLCNIVDAVNNSWQVGISEEDLYELSLKKLT